MYLLSYYRNKLYFGNPHHLFSILLLNQYVLCRSQSMLCWFRHGEYELLQGDTCRNCPDMMFQSLLPALKITHPTKSVLIYNTVYMLV